jgi:hypothetical protein
MPVEIMPLLQAFMPVFSERTWDWVVILVIGAIQSPGKRTVSAALRSMGLHHEKQYQRYHRVLNRASWSSLGVGKILLGLLIEEFEGGGPLILGADETLERRQGRKIKAKGYFRDGVRSTAQKVVTSCGLRWLSLMVLAEVPWTGRRWALPFLTVLTPSAKTQAAHGKRPKTPSHWLGQMIAQVRRWLPTTPIILITDGGFASLQVGDACRQQSVTYITRLRLDAGLYDFPTLRPPGKRGRTAFKGTKQPTLQTRLTTATTLWTSLDCPWYGGQKRRLEIVTDTALWYSPKNPLLPLRWVLVRDPEGQLKPTAFLSTDLTLTPEQILTYFIQRWSIEVTFQEVRAHLGFETQRQWSDLAILRTTPALLGLFSFIVLLAQTLTHGKPLPTQSAAWYPKSSATFSDVLAFVQATLAPHLNFFNSLVGAKTSFNSPRVVSHLDPPPLTSSQFG